MNKRHALIAVALVALLLGTSCSTFFTGDVRGKVVSSDDRGIEGAKVALYFDKDQRDADARDYKETKLIHTSYSTETKAEGMYVIPNIPWDSAFPEYGKDADEIEFFILVYHEDFGVRTYDPEMKMVSGRPNEVNIDIGDDLVNDVSLRVDFHKGGTEKSSEGIRSFKYSYLGNPGCEEGEEFEGTAIVENGTAIIPSIRYFDRNEEGDEIAAPEVRIYDIRSYKQDSLGDEYVQSVVPESHGIQITYKSCAEFKKQLDPELDNKLVIETVPYRLDFEGFNGQVFATENNFSTNDVQIGLYDADAPDDLIYAVNADPDMDKSNILLKFYTYEGLGKDIVFKNEKLDPAYEQKYIIRVYDGAISSENKKQEKEVSISCYQKPTDNNQNFTVTFE